MLFKHCELKKSKLHGVGLFAKQEIAKGSLVVFWPVTDRHEIVREEQLPTLVSKDAKMVDSISRLFGNYFVVSSTGIYDYEKINHSPNPNLLYFFGFLVALQDIGEGEELTIDYTLAASPTVPENVGNENLLIASSGREAAVRSIREFSDLLLEVNEWIG